jgi:hypothetical protein
LSALIDIKSHATTTQAIELKKWQFGQQTVICSYQTHAHPTLVLLDRLDPVKTAFHNHTDAAPECLKGTRTDLLDGITTWMNDPSAETVYWLSGAAGTGKTTVAQSVAKIAKESNFICASFFFSRTSEDRRNFGKVVPSLAYQLGNSKLLRSPICTAIESDGDISIHSVPAQVQSLIAEVLAPLPSDLPPCLLIALDALDECNEDRKSVHGGELIPVLLAALKKMPFAKLFVTSRRESSIERLFSRKTAAGDTRALVLHRDIPKDTVQADIERYIRDELATIKEDMISETEDFPSEPDVHTLVQRADGLFIYARTAVEYIRDPDSYPEEQLSALVRANSGRDVGQYALLDELYTHILMNALRATAENRHIVNAALRNVLVTLVLVCEPVSVEAIASLAGVETRECERFLRRTSAVLEHDIGTSNSVRLIHLSFPDFLSQPNRCNALPEYRVNPVTDHLRMTEHCLQQLNFSLRYDICDIRDPSLFNTEVRDLKQRLKTYISGFLQYACRFWAHHWLEHLCAAGSECRVPVGLIDFCDKHLFHWIEILSLIEGLDVVARVMPKLLRAMNVSLKILLKHI